MSYDIDLVCKCCKSAVKSFGETYNRSHIYYDNLDSELGIRWIYGKTYGEIKERCEQFIEKTGTECTSDAYDSNCKGWAGYKIQEMLEAAKEYPNCIFEGD